MTESVAPRDLTPAEDKPGVADRDRLPRWLHDRFGGEENWSVLGTAERIAWQETADEVIRAVALWAVYKGARRE